MTMPSSAPAVWFSELIGWFNTNSGAMTALATIALVVVTGFYVCLVYGQGRQLRRQANLLQERDRTEAKRAVHAIILEVLTNNRNLDTRTPEGRAPFLCDAYRSGSWALIEVGASFDAVYQISEAHVWASKYNLLVRIGYVEKEDEELQDAWGLVKNAIVSAIGAIKRDGILKDYLAAQKPEAD